MIHSSSRGAAAETSELLPIPDRCRVWSEKDERATSRAPKTTVEMPTPIVTKLDQKQ